MDTTTTLAWVRAEIEPLATSLQPALPEAASVSLCEYLRDGRALVLLTAALPAADDNQQQDVAALPKHLQRSLHQTTTFHALERIQFFLKWCRADAALDAFVVFSSVQLLDEQNNTVVAACLDALRSKFRSQLKGPATPVVAVKTTAVAPAVAPSTPSKSSGLWVKRSSAHQLLASPASSSRNNSDSSSNQSSHEVPPPVSALSNRLNAFLNKFPSETNVLTPVAVVPSPFVVADVQPQEDEDKDEDNNVEEEEAVETYNEDEEDAVLPQEPRAPFADALSPRSERSQSSFGSSLSFSFTSDPRHHESFADDAPHMNMSFSSAHSSPPASPKPAPRLRIPSIFERSTEKTAASDSGGSSAATDRSSLTSSVKDENAATAPRAVSKLSIPAAFSSSSSSTVSIESAATSDAVEAENAAAAPKPVSKLSIPAAFSRSTSTSSDRASFSKSTLTTTTAAAQETSTSSSPQPTLVKKPSRLKIPSAFASGSAAVAPAVVVEVAAVPAPVEEIAAVDETVQGEETAAQSPLAAFVTSPSASLSESSSSSVSSTSSRPLASKLATFLSTVEVFPTAVVTPSSDNVAVVAAAKELADQKERFSDDESDSDDSLNADDDDDGLAQHFSEEIAFDGVRFSLSQETAIGLPDDVGPHGHVHNFERLSLSSEPPAANEAAMEDHEEEEHTIDHHDHTDSEQPFFVVEEVSMSRPATSSKLYAFLSAVDSTESPRLSHTSSSAAGEDKILLEEAAALAAARLSGGSHKSGGSQRNSVEDTTTSEHSDRSPSNSFTSQPLASASSDVILEKERLSGENLALQLKLRTAEAQLSAKDVASASLRAEIVTLQAQLTATPSDFRLRTAAEASKAQVVEAKATHVKTIKAAQAAREQFLSEKKLLEDQLRTIKTQSVSALAALSAQLAEAKKAHLKTITSAQASREQLASDTKLLEGQLRAVTQQSQSAALAFNARLADAKKAHVKTIQTVQFSREHFANENVQLKTFALQKQSAAAAYKNQVAELKKAHLKTIKTVQFSREQLLTSGSKLVEATPVVQMTTATSVAVHQDDSRLAVLVQQSKTLEQHLQDAKDSEEAARNSVQTALVELIRSQQATIAELSQRVGR